MFLLTLLACKPEATAPPVEVVPEILDFAQVIPASGLASGLEPQTSNNNLDIEWHDSRLFLAWRTAPNHFASKETVMYVASTTDEQEWRYEGEFWMGHDLREPQLVSWDGELRLYMARLGDHALAFEPQGMVHSVYSGPGQWSDPVEWPDPTFIPWRIKPIDGTLHMIGYSGGENIYEPEGDPIEIRWLTSTDAETWTPAVPGSEVIQAGGGSETDFVFLDNGDLIGVTRNEAGDELGFGSKICRADVDDLATWDCVGDPRKYDSPLLFQRNGRIWLVARRNVTDSGNYDLFRDDLEPGDQYYLYQIAYWNQPKRCSLWEVDPDALTVEWVLDLPSRGDTCFPETVDLDGEVLLYNYSSDPEGPDLSWLEGQMAPTMIYRMILRLP
jgi:hypothetical protein